jgi:hypothetical protein
MNQFNSINSVYNGGAISLTNQFNNVSIFNNYFIGFYCSNGLGLAINLVNGGGRIKIINNIFSNVYNGVIGYIFLL